MTDSRSSNLTKPLASYGHARRVGQLVYLAGQGCRDPKTDVWAGVTFDAQGKQASFDFEAQVRGVLRNVDAVLANENLTRRHIVDVHVFLTNMSEQFPVLNKVWNEFFKDMPTPPVRTTIGVKELPGLNLVEMKVIAAHE
jgi:2-aminomuconate deaminase